LAGWLRSLRSTYLAADPRSLGLFRIGFGLLLLGDLWHRYRDLDFFYTNAGLLPNHTLLWRPPGERVFSLFFAASSRGEAQLGFALCAVVYLLFCAGYRTRLMHAAALICRVSLNSRIAVLENGGDMVINLLCIFSLALPLGRRFSLDAWLARPGAGERTQVYSLAMLGLIGQFALIYFFNALSKQGAAWLNGEAVHYALHQDKFVTPLGVWMREQLPPEALRALTWSVLATEWLGFALIITPLFRDAARLIAIMVLPPLHVGFALGLDLGMFSPAMISFYPLLLTRAHWDWLARRRGLQALAARLGALRWDGLRARLARPAPASRAGRWGAELAVAALIGAIATEIVNDNHGVPQRLRWQRAEWTRALIEYPRLLQGWRMFAPEPPLTDSMIYVDALTARGEHVDPYNRAASREPFPAGQVVPARLNQSQFFTMYSDRIGYPDYAAYRQALLEWLLAYPKRSGDSGDCLLSFDAYLVTDKSPPFASREPSRPLTREKFLRYVAPKNGDCKKLERGSDLHVARAP
jgi:hypothetical protein